jgi:hypothetical protein
MKKFITRILVWCLKKINEDLLIPEMAGYEPKKVGLSLSIDKRCINSFRKGAEGMSYREGKKKLVADTRNRIYNAILHTCLRDGIIETSVSTLGDKIVISANLKCYAPKD